MEDNKNFKSVDAVSGLKTTGYFLDLHCDDPNFLRASSAVSFTKRASSNSFSSNDAKYLKPVRI